MIFQLGTKGYGKYSNVRKPLSKLNYPKAIKNLTTLRENLDNLLTNPQYLIPYLAHSLESEVTDKDGKKSKVDNKDAILSALKAAIENNPMYGEDTKKLRLQDIEDLGKIVDSYREYDKKLTEFMTTPSKVEQQHRKADNKAKNKSIKSLFSNIKKEINFKKPSSIKAVYNKYKQAVQDAGGWNAFLATLSEEERKAVTSAVGEDDIKDAVKKAAASDDQADDRVKKAAQQVLDGIPEYSKEAIIALSKDSSPLDPAITKAAEKAVEDEGINDAVAKAAAIATKEEEIKKSINKAVQLAANAISESNDAENDKLQKSIKNLAENPSQDGTPNITAEMANTNDGTPNISPDGLADDSSEDSFYKESHNRSQNYVEQERKKQSFVPQSRKRGYERRRQFTEYYLFGKDGQTLYDYYFTQFDFPSQENKPYRTSGGNLVWNNELKSNIPSNWSSISLSDIINILSGFAFSSSSIKEHFDTSSAYGLSPEYTASTKSLIRSYG